MTTLEVLHKQTQDAYEWTNKLLNSIAYEKLDIILRLISGIVAK